MRFIACRPTDGCTCAALLSTLRNPPALRSPKRFGSRKCIAPQNLCKNQASSTKFHEPIAHALAKPRTPLLVSPQKRIRCAVCSESPWIHGARFFHLNRHGASDFRCCGIGTWPPGLQIPVIFFQSLKLGEFLDKFRTSVWCDKVSVVTVLRNPFCCLNSMFAEPSLVCSWKFLTFSVRVLLWTLTLKDWNSQGLRWGDFVSTDFLWITSWVRRVGGNCVSVSGVIR